MKTRFEDLLIWLLTKLNYHRLQSVTIDTKLIIEIRKIVPMDNKFHHISANVSYWTKRSKSKPDIYDEVTIFRDGKSVKNIKEQYKFL